VLVGGTVLSARLAFWPAAVPERALIVNRLGEPRTGGLPWPAQDIGATLDRHAHELARDPWLDRQLCLLDGVTVAPGAPWFLVDRAGAALPLRGDRHDVLLALSGGHPLVVSAEWDGFTLLPLTAFGDGRVSTLLGEVP
jgi:hypothetical protein